jgi:hypothetical protein
MITPYNETSVNGCCSRVGKGRRESAYSKPGIAPEDKSCHYCDIEENSRKGAVVALLAKLISVGCKLGGGSAVAYK